MGLGRRDFLLTVPVLVGAAACGSAQRAVRDPGYVELASTSSANGKPNVLVCMPETRHTREVWTGLCDELAREFRLVAVKVDHSSQRSTIARAIELHSPSAIVLMNNPTVVAYGAYQVHVGGRRFPPAVIVMTSFLDGSPLQVVCATGVSYEVPLITMVTNLRKLIATPIERVGVVRRDALAGFVARQAMLGVREQIRVIEEPIGVNPNPSELKRALRRLKQRCDVLWVLNDDRLLSPRLIAEGWLPGLDERRWVPAIVGVASLVSPAHSLGTFAMLPDHTALGAQAANMIFDILADGGTLPADSKVELPVSNTTIVALTQVNERFQLRPDALQQVDRILE